MKKKPFIIGIAGGTGAGKTTVVNNIMQKVDKKSVLAIQYDFYYRDRSHLLPSEREKINYDHPNSLETDLLIRQLKKIMVGRKVEIPDYDYKTHTRRMNGRIIGAVGVIIIEGLYTFYESELRDLLDLKIYINTDEDVRFIRRLQRDVRERGRDMNSTIQQYMETVRPMYKEFVEPSKKYANVIFSGEQTVIIVDILISLINEKIALWTKECQR